MKGFFIFNFLCRALSLASREVPVKHLNCQYLKNIGKLAFLDLFSCQCPKFVVYVVKMLCNLNMCLDYLNEKCVHT